MATKKKTTLESIAAQMAVGFAKQGNEIHDLTEMVGFVVKHRATKEDVREIAREEIGMR